MEPSRRSFLASLVPLFLASPWALVSRAGPGRLTARPLAPGTKATSGRTDLAMERGRGAVLYVPQSYRHEVAAPLILMLHGATQNAEFSLEVLRGAADEHGFVLLAPNSLGTTWDAIRGGFGPDVARIDRVLDETFRRCRIDPSRITVAGFSDGASYALALGLVNGDLFRRVMAFSPGFVAGDSERHGRPAIFVSHGLRDRILPIARTSRRLVPALREAGHAVEYYEFDGPHWVTDDALDRGMLWLKGAEAAADG